MRSGTVLKAAGLVAAAAVGCTLAVLAAALHRMAWRTDGFTLPWGLVLSVTSAVLCAVAAGVVLGRRPGTLAVVGGWAVTMYVLLRGRPEGDYVISGDPLGWGFLLAAAAAMALLVAASLTGTPQR